MRRAARPAAFALACALIAQAFPAAAVTVAHPQSAPAAPAAAQHTEFVVEVNAKGQVTRVRSGTASKDPAFNTLTYGNALQAFIRTADGRAISGLYRLTYDYDPHDRMVSRHVALIHAGGVNPSALGAVNVEMKRRSAQAPVPSPAATDHLPDFNSITGHGSPPP